MSYRDTLVAIRGLKADIAALPDCDAKAGLAARLKSVETKL